MRLALLLAAACLAAPSATACSLSYQPFAQAQGDADTLRFVDGTRLLEVVGSREQEVADAYMLSFAAADGDLIVAGQDGLGADCSGDGWLRRYHLADGGPGRAWQQAWERAGASRVWPHAGGPIAQVDGAFFRVAAGALVPFTPTPPLPEGTYVTGWTHDARPVYRHDGALWVGGARAAEDAFWEPAVAASPDAFAYAYHDDREAVLTIVEDGGRAVWTARFAARVESVQLVWADAWYVLAGGRVHRVERPQATVQDLGVAAVGLGTMHGHALVFSEDGYVEYDGVRPVAARQRVQGVWLQSQLPAEGAESDLPARWAREDALGDPGGTPQAGGRGIPASSLPAALALVLAAAALAAMRRRDAP